MRTLTTIALALFLAFTATGEARALAIEHAHVEPSQGYTFVTVGVDRPLHGRVVVTVYVDGEVWRSKSWQTFGNSVVELYFTGRPPQGELSVSIRH
jgi:hypothetical protein